MSVAAYLRWAWPADLPWSHFPAGERRDAKTGAKLKAMGLAAGWPDFVLLLPKGHVAFIELKAAVGDLSEAQREFRDLAIANGHGHAVCRSMEEVGQACARWLSLFGRRLSARTVAVSEPQKITPLGLAAPSGRRGRAA